MIGSYLSVSVTRTAFYTVAMVMSVNIIDFFHWKNALFLYMGKMATCIHSSSFVVLGLSTASNTIQVVNNAYSTQLLHVFIF